MNGCPGSCLNFTQTRAGTWKGKLLTLSSLKQLFLGEFRSQQQKETGPQRELAMTGHAYDPDTLAAEAGGLPGV